MKNPILHALSNRPGPFKTEAFGQSLDFLPAALSPEAQSLRKALLLDVESSDYYLKVYLSLIEAYPDLHYHFHSDNASYRMQDMIPRGVRLDGADFVSSNTLPGLFTDPVLNSLPVNLTFTIDYQEPSIARVTGVEQGTVSVTDCQLSQSRILHVAWPAWAPFSGPLQLPSAWMAGTRVIIETEPSNFPFGKLLERIASSNYLRKLLGDFDLLDEYYFNFDEQEQAAIALTVVGLSHPLYGNNSL